ncbi:hypothetical protein EJ02DRAFT_458560 [Clathrospora elynae]|uniref:Uncharacterized protein n=1 Tax=Clathrospora elynae TaxID=706981 RepID=A0A6A5SAQ5_9PLEO|nr:hypothetical protein EJ02DRAFT_458560 [Clathrospora elynae]
MFRAFSFEPASPPAYSVYEAERAAMNVSPTSRAIESQYLPNRPLTPPCTIGDLAMQLNQQSLHIDTHIRCYPRVPLTLQSGEHDSALPTDQMEQPRPTYSRVAASVLRMQRQASSRMQCSSSHVRDISKLAKMIEEQEQCTINEASSRTSSTSTASASSGDDEGVDMEYDLPAQGIEALAGLPAWRCGDARDSRDSCIRVTKSVRMRKRSKGNGVMKRRSS